MSTEATHSYPITKDHPLPAKRTRPREQRYPFPQMHVGDSFDGHEEAEARRISNAAHQYVTRFPGEPKPRFTIRVVENDFGVKVPRCWRIE